MRQVPRRRHFEKRTVGALAKDIKTLRFAAVGPKYLEDSAVSAMRVAPILGWCARGCIAIQLNYRRRCTLEPRRVASRPRDRHLAVGPRHCLRVAHRGARLVGFIREKCVTIPAKYHLWGIRTEADISSLMGAATRAWSKANKGDKRVTFYWRGQEFESKQNELRMMVNTLKGEPIVCRDY